MEIELNSTIDSLTTSVLEHDELYIITVSEDSVNTDDNIRFKLMPRKD